MLHFKSKVQAIEGARKEREKCLELALADKEDIEIELRKKLEMSEKRESDLENDLAGMWVQLARLKKEKGMNPFLLNPEAHDNVGSDASSIDTQGDTDDSIPMKKKPITQELYTIEELQANLEEERKRNLQLSSLVSQLKVTRICIYTYIYYKILKCLEILFFYLVRSIAN